MAFEEPGKIMPGCAYANGKLIVPNTGVMMVEDPVTPEPVPGAYSHPGEKTIGREENAACRGIC